MLFLLKKNIYYCIEPKGKIIRKIALFISAIYDYIQFLKMIQAYVYLGFEIIS